VRGLLAANREAVDGYKALVKALDAASRIVERYPEGAPDVP
jgi:hypothetical protein